MAEIGDRLRQLRKVFNESQQKFAIRIGISRSYINSIESNKQEPSFSFVQKLTDVINVSPTWFMVGMGSMFLPKEDDKGESFPVRIEDEITSEVIDLMSNIDAQGKQTVLLAARQAERIVQLERKLTG
jgi:transcriptional regulator with XRE-family HTH domain